MIVSEVSALCVVIWRGAVTRERFELQRAGLARVVANHPANAGFLCVVEPTAEPPNDELRRASIDMVNEHAGRLKCVACIIEGSGFRAAITRSVLSGMKMVLPRRGVPVSFFATVDDGLMWVKEHMKTSPLIDMHKGVTETRSQLS